MLLSVTTDSDSCSLEVADDLELENFKALCEAEVCIPSDAMTVLVNGLPLTDGKKSLQQLGVKDGDLVMIIRDTNRQVATAGAAPLPAAAATGSTVSADIAQFDFSSIQVPDSIRHGNTVRAGSQRPSTSQQRNTGGDVSSAPPAADASAAAAAEGGGEDDPAVILDLLKSHPDQLARLSHNNPALAEAAMKGLEEFSKVLKDQHEAKAEKERQRIRMITADPFDAETQKLIACEIEKENIDANMEAAMEYNPESFGTVQMLYINCSVNGHPVKAFIDSGAQTTIMSEVCARRCNIMRLVDQRWAGVAKGVGTQKIIGRVHMVQLEIEGVYLASSFSILQEQPMDMLLGLDMLKRHQMVIDLNKNALQIGTSNTSTRFLSDADLPECARITSASAVGGEEKAKMESEQQARETEDQEIAKALAASAADADVAMDTDGGGESSSSNAGVSAPAAAIAAASVSDSDISEVMAAGFSRDQAVEELTRQGGDKTQAIAALFAKNFAFK